MPRAAPCGRLNARHAVSSPPPRRPRSRGRPRRTAAGRRPDSGALSHADTRTGGPRRPLQARDALRSLPRLHARRRQGELDDRGRVSPVAQRREDAARGDREEAQGRPRRALHGQPREAQPLSSRRPQRRARSGSDKAREWSSTETTRSTSSSCGRARRGPGVWLVSSQTLREVPAAFKDLRRPSSTA